MMQQTKINHRELVIIGAGPAGLAAAIAAYDRGVRDILILERDHDTGGILQQCIHNGFGLHRFKEELTGPEYAGRLAEQVRERNIECRCGAMVTRIGRDRRLTMVCEEEGVVEIEATAIILAMGCRERSRGALNIAGARPAGVYTAGAAQRFVNMRGCMVGKKVVILGSGDIGLIMARRMTLEGAKVEAVLEIMPYSGGLKRNIVQCLDDFGIPLLLSHTITEIRGHKRVEAVTIARVDEQRRPIPGTERDLDCDAVLLSVGLLPENELTKMAGVTIDRVTGGARVDERRETDVPGIFACGNVLHVHDLADFASEEAELAGVAAADLIRNKRATASPPLTLKAGRGVRYVVPQQITDKTAEVKCYFRVADVYKQVTVTVKDGDRAIRTRKRRIVAPGEMESLTLKASELAAVDGQELVFSLEGGED